MKILIPTLVYRKIMHFVHKADFEVSGFGKCSYLPESDVILVHDAFLLKQEGGAAHTDIDATSLAKAMFLTKDEPGKLAFWWHSHVNMQAFWSGQDTTTIKSLGGQGWATALVLNKKEEYRAAFCGKYVDALGIERIQLDDNIDMEIVDPDLDASVIAAWDNEFAENVARTAPEPVWPRWNGVYENSREPWQQNEIWREDILVGSPHKKTEEYDKYTLAEARFLKMSPRELTRIYESGSMEEIEEIEVKLMNFNHRGM